MWTKPVLRFALNLTFVAALLMLTAHLISGS